MLGNNETSILLTRDFKSQNQKKYIDVMHHHIRRLIADGKLAIDWIKSSAILADGLTKAFSAAFFKKY